MTYDATKVVMSDPAMGAPRLEPMLRKTVLSEVVRPISLFLTERTRRFWLATSSIPRPPDATARYAAIWGALVAVGIRKNPAAPSRQPMYRNGLTPYLGVRRPTGMATMSMASARGRR